MNVPMPYCALYSYINTLQSYNAIHKRWDRVAAEGCLTPRHKVLGLIPTVCTLTCRQEAGSLTTTCSFMPCNRVMQKPHLVDDFTQYTQYITCFTFNSFLESHISGKLVNYYYFQVGLCRFDLWQYPCKPEVSTVWKKEKQRIYFPWDPLPLVTEHRAIPSGSPVVCFKEERDVTRVDLNTVSEGFKGPDHISCPQSKTPLNTRWKLMKKSTE